MALLTESSGLLLSRSFRQLRPGAAGKHRESGREQCPAPVAHQCSIQKPKAYSVPSPVVTYSWPPPAETLPSRTDDAIALPLFHSSFPVAASSAYRVACPLPEDSANTTPLRINDVGEIMSREVQPGCRVGALFCSTSVHATIAPAAGASSQRVPARSCQLANGPAVKSPVPQTAAVL